MIHQAVGFVEAENRTVISRTERNGKLFDNVFLLRKLKDSGCGWATKD